MLSQLNAIIAGNLTAFEQQIAKIDEYLFSLHSPQRYDGPTGLQVTLKKGFDEVCIALETQGIAHPEKLSVRRFYGAIEALKKKGG